ncbi:hypothetical protein GCM10027456_63210 [Kineosporia babensis]
MTVTIQSGSHAELGTPGAFNDDDSFMTMRHTSGVRTRMWMSAISPRTPTPGSGRSAFRVCSSRKVSTRRNHSRSPGDAPAQMAPD